MVFFRAPRQVTLARLLSSFMVIGDSTTVKRR